jgi:hypothetical protein
VGASRAKTIMSRSDDELAETTRRARTSLDAQRFTFTPRLPSTTAATTMTATTTMATATSTFLLPILHPTPVVRQTDVQTQPFQLKELAGTSDVRSASSAAALLPQEIANADLSLAGVSVPVRSVPFSSPPKSRQNVP